ncbi:hypothetical protein K470DRAFT_272852 [Piedraia hortae CBS 480.64]|uniref:Uncharacterized protein n=1 Tax=Piedraia hortae CBS 480.64 TaxID=1314780 RepID=A0A6A7BRT9_9PEZI|nr:hypothetical protein K470DRAFT_272852 [Piedraia hortae CBS 480.64]
MDHTQQTTTPPQPAVSKPTKSADTAEDAKDPVSLLIEINVELLAEVNKLQIEGKGGATSNQQVAQLRAQGLPGDLAAPEYIDVLRRVQANLAFLVARAQQQQGKQPQGQGASSQAEMIRKVIMMGPPIHMAHLADRYRELKEKFDEGLG